MYQTVKIGSFESDATNLLSKSGFIRLVHNMREGAQDKMARLVRLAQRDTFLMEFGTVQQE